MTAPLNRAVIVIEGNVQGVFFRTNAQTKAQKLGVTGVAENLSNGTVRIVAEAKKTTLEQFIAWCQTGPPFASVQKIAVEWHEAQGLFKNFEIR